MRVLSVDLGTSNTVAVLSAHGRPPRVVEVDGSATMPSAVFAAEDGGLVVGRDAERRARLDPARFEPNPKRRVDDTTLLLGNTVITVTDAMAAVLQRVADETKRQLGGSMPDEVRLTHPAQWGAIRRNVLLSAARLAGFGPQLTLVPEPVAAAAHFASFPERSLAPGQALAVYDLGAGTFDVAVVGATPSGFVVLAENGLPDLGGLDVDHALLVHVGREVSYRDPSKWQRVLRPESTADRRARRTLLEDVRAAKEALSRHPQTEVPMPEPFDDVLVTRAELEALIRPSLLRSIELLADTIGSAGMSPESLAGIYLVGGSSRIPLVAKLISERLRVVPTSLDQPETAVALGAHHVPQDGTSARTGQLPPQEMYQGGVTAPYPTTVTNGPSFPTTGPQPVQHQAPPQYGGFPQVPQQQAKKSSKPMLIGVAASIVVVLAVVLGIVLLNGSGLPSASECQKPGEADPKGFSSCLRQLAGDVADNVQCDPGAKGLAENALGRIQGVKVTCQLPAGNGAPTLTVTYAHAPSMEIVQDIAKNVVGDSRTEQVEADWGGNGLTGHYQATTNEGVGYLVFTVKDRPVLGMMTVISTSGAAPKANDLADYFERQVQPGT
ncbi:Hsp70 family protein [Allokutzneria albata]|uniref:Hsp70 protein n=1 Tax=Allokutzneria albata TaxID=211114 RepID=A0A1H0CSK0_ALLAB|nr:Hsp70 family protein [Allokutzneria albata]SDN60853.1 Hsp70 protein [Allokutzneria albata]